MLKPAAISTIRFVNICQIYIEMLGNQTTGTVLYGNRSECFYLNIFSNRNMD